MLLQSFHRNFCLYLLLLKSKLQYTSLILHFLVSLRLISPNGFDKFKIIDIIINTISIGGAHNLKSFDKQIKISDMYVDNEN